MKTSVWIKRYISVLLILSILFNVFMPKKTFAAAIVADQLFMDFLYLAGADFVGRGTMADAIDDYVEKNGEFYRDLSFETAVAHIKNNYTLRSEELRSMTADWYETLSLSQQKNITSAYNYALENNYAISINATDMSRLGFDSFGGIFAPNVTIDTTAFADVIAGRDYVKHVLTSVLGQSDSDASTAVNRLIQKPYLKYLTVLGFGSAELWEGAIYTPSMKAKFSENRLNCSNFKKTLNVGTMICANDLSNSSNLPYFPGRSQDYMYLANGDNVDAKWYISLSPYGGTDGVLFPVTSNTTYEINMSIPYGGYAPYPLETGLPSAYPARDVVIPDIRARASAGSYFPDNVFDKDYYFINAAIPDLPIDWDGEVSPPDVGTEPGTEPGESAKDYTKELNNLKTGLKDLSDRVDGVETDAKGIAGVLEDVIGGINKLSADTAESFSAIKTNISESFTNLGGSIIGTGTLDFDGFKTKELTSIFPFCIPFDIFNCIKSLNVTPQAPVFRVSFAGTKMAAANDIVLDLTDYDSLAQVVRFFVFIIFIFGLIQATRVVVRG